MALMPKRVKYRKKMRGKMRGNASRGNYVAFGEYGIQALSHHWITGRQIEAGRIAATHFLHRQGKVYIRIFPDHSYTSKPLEVRMGKGKAEVEGWVARVKPGTVLYEISGVPEDVAKAALARVAHKMPVRCRFVTRRHSLG
ncbi:50S ribosomal protein L16 [Anaerohalosphaera lusitana]|uniref:Large ribosomal subunit protein uL16 n=1 Tax=Anaerohalosphaera lusitana TaxID=1936003 RepID=A0A1U9NQR1_9BACT|nr:50S ribosomal protein L16 [Anaerohalosphaera lusitana]AQT69846.1 50S ribosomal protein L16 [Anaerohalosphaera lusitana]